MLKRKSKRVLSIVLAVAMIAGLFPIAAFADGGELPTPNDDGVIKLTEDVTLTAPFTVAQNKNVTIDLNGHKITNASGQHTIVNNGTLIINDSSKNKSGIVDNISHARGAIYNGVTGNVTLNGGTYERSQENGQSAEDAGGNSWYVLKNYGKMTINAGVKVLQNGHFSSMVANGWFEITKAPGNGEPKNNGEKATLIINGGTFTGGLNTIKNDDNGVLEITAGTFSNVTQAVVHNHNEATISGGTFEVTKAEEASKSTYGIYNCGCDETHDIGKLTISGGIFSGATFAYGDVSSVPTHVYIMGGTFTGESGAIGTSENCQADISISGGAFSTKVDSLVATGYECVKDENSNMYVIQTASKMEASSEVSGEGTASTTVGGSFTPSTENGDNVDTTDTTLNITATTGDQGAQNDSVTTSNVTIAPAALTSVNEADSVQNVAIKTDVATVTVDSAAWNAMTTNAGNESVTLSVEEKAATDSAPLTYTLKATNASGGEVYSASNAAGAITISVPYSNGSNPKVFYVGSKGLEDMNASLTDGILSWIARHFSDYVVLDDSVIATITTSDGNVSSYTDADAFATAVENAADGSVVELMKNITLDATGKANTQGILTITKNITINGNGKTITAENVTKTPSMINVQSGANVTINDLIINGETNDTFTAGTKHGININQAGTVTLNDVTIQNNRWYAVMNNGSDLVLNGLTTSGNQWGINVDNKGGDANLIVNNAGIAEESSIVFDKGDTGKITATINGGSFRDVVMGKDANEKPITTIDSLIINGGTFKTAGIAHAIDVEDYLAPGLVYNPYTGQVYKEPEYTGKYSYEIFTKVGDNGTISVDRYATEGDNVTITVSPDEAYMLDELTVTANGKEVEVKDNGDGTYTFKMPSADAKIVVTFAEDPDWEPAPEMPFTDVNEGDWFYDVVLYAYDNGLMTGVSATEFAPNQTTTRGMIVSMLARLEGVTNAEDAGFADVADNDWYATAVNWAASVGVVNGYEDNTFRPNAPITREQMAAILYNYADYKGYDVSARADLSDYADAASISSWAEDVLAWANAEGLINGMTATTIDPQGATTRAQTAAMFERFLTAHEA